MVLCPLSAWGGGGEGTLVVTVMSPIDEGDPEPVPGAQVDVDAGVGTRPVFTNPHGQAVIHGIPPGEHWFTASLAGFGEKDGLIDIHAGTTRHVTVSLSLGFLECTLGERWDYRGLLEPGIPQTMSIFGAGENP